MKTHFAEHIESACPGLVVEKMDVNEIVQLKRETEILQFLKDRLPLPILEPVYCSLERVEPGTVFAGYRRIEG